MQEHQHHQPNEDSPKSFWKTPLGWVFLGFVAIAGYFLLTEHTAHVIRFLPWLLLLACPFLHFFGHGHGDHGGHGRHGRRDRNKADEPTKADPRDEAESIHRH